MSVNGTYVDETSLREGQLGLGEGLEPLEEDFVFLLISTADEELSVGLVLSTSQI